MDQQEWRWHSDRVGREMAVARWGHFGVPVVLFPTAAADCYDYDRFLMIKVLRPLIEAGRIKVYCCESITGDAWMRRDAHPGHKAALQAAFGDYLVHELLPHVSRDSGGVRGFIAAGASLGAYNALHAAARTPEWFSGVVAMSGTYDFDRWMDGHRDERYYLHQPMYYLAGVPPGPQLDGIRRVRWVVASGQGRAEAPDESRRITGLLRGKGAQVELEIWGADAHHDWPTWRTMLPMFLDRLTAKG